MKLKFCTIISKRENMDWLVQYPFAHRGLHKGFKTPENSLLAFQRAISKNYAIELDVRITKDKQVVVFHDKNIIRICGVKKKIANQNYASLEKHTLYNTNQKIPLFNEVLKLIDGKVPVLIEIKNYGQVGEFEQLVLNELKDYSGDYAVCSFNQEVIKWFKENRPDIIRGLIYGDLHKFGIKYPKLTFIYRLITSSPDFISLDYKLLNTPLPKICRIFKKPLVTWTINRKRKLRKANALVDNIVFENIKPFIKNK